MIAASSARPARGSSTSTQTSSSVRGPTILVERDPARIRRDLDESHPEAGAADVDVAQRDLARHEREAVLVLLPARVLPGGEEKDRNQQQEHDAHLTCIGRVRLRP
jgi:hypothetical protein